MLGILAEFIKTMAMDIANTYLQNTAANSVKKANLTDEIKSYLDRQFEDKLSNLAQSSEIDFEGLVTYLSRTDVSVVLCEIDEEVRERKLQTIMAKAFEAAHADNCVKQKVVEKIVNDVCGIVHDACMKYVSDEHKMLAADTVEAVNSHSDKQFSEIKGMLRTNEQSPKDKPFVITIKSNAETAPVSNFIGRDDELKALRKIAEANTDKILLHGIGGIGKTQLCRKLYSEYVEDYKGGNLFPIQHIGYLQYSDSMDGTVANAMDIPDTFAPSDRIAAAWTLLKGYTNSHEKTLLIIDDINNFVKQDNSLSKLSELQCAVIVTSRNDKLVGIFHTHHVDKMPVEECIAIFEQGYGKVSDEQLPQLRTLIEERVCRHTLTVRLLGGIADNNGWNVTLLRDELEQHRFELTYLDDGNEMANLIKEYEKLFKLSQFGDDETGKLRLHILEAFSVFPYAGLPLTLCNQWLSEDTGQADLAIHANALCGLSWLEKTEDKKIAMHPVIAEVIRYTRKPVAAGHIGLIDACAESCNLDIGELHKQEVEVWKFGEEILRWLYDEEVPEIGLLSNNVGTAFCEFGHYGKALECLKQAVAIREKILGICNLVIATTYNNIAAVYYTLGDNSKAFEYLNRTLVIRQELLGTDCIEISRIYSNIAEIYRASGCYTDALECSSRALSISEKIAGKDNVDTITICNNMAGAYHALGDYNKALECSNRALLISEKILGTDHLDTAICYNNIAGFYHRLGDCNKALAYHDKALTIREKNLGKNHPFTATIYNNIAAVYHTLGNYDKALPLGITAYKICLTKLGSNHPNTVSIYNNAQDAYAKTQNPIPFPEWLQQQLANQ